MQCILKRDHQGGAVYLGNLDAASNINNLKQHHINAVLTVAAGTNLHYNIMDISMHETINVRDTLYEDIS